jgi:hypothetical protein
MQKIKEMTLRNYLNLIKKRKVLKNQYQNSNIKYMQDDLLN